ncbi:MAG: hypothetical protein WC166_06245 [Bacteroidales bacterium]
MAPRFKMRAGTVVLFITSGIIGFLATFTLFISRNIILISVGLFCFGVAFVFLQSTLVTMAQNKLPQAKGTAMSMTSFNMFVGGSLGTMVNAGMINSYSTSDIYLVAAVLLLAVGSVSAMFAKRHAVLTTLNAE